MEFVLNLVWTTLAVVMVRLWMRHASREGASRWTQPIALFMVLLIVLPVISLTDDLQMARNPAEADAYYLTTRRDHAVAGPHANFSSSASTLPLPVFTWLSFGVRRLAAPFHPSVFSVDNPALTSIQNRPPPAA